MTDKVHGSWSQHGDRGRGTFEDNGYGDTSDARKTGSELPEGYKDLDVDNTVDTQAVHTSSKSGVAYDGIPSQT